MVYKSKIRLNIVSRPYAFFSKNFENHFFPYASREGEMNILFKIRKSPHFQIFLENSIFLSFRRWGRKNAKKYPNYRHLFICNHNPRNSHAMMILIGENLKNNMISRFYFPTCQWGKLPKMTNIMAICTSVSIPPTQTSNDHWYTCVE